MKNQQKLLLGLVSGVAVLSLTLGVEGAGAPAEAAPTSELVRVVEAHPFELDRPTVHTYRAEQPVYDSGWLVVLDAGGPLVARQTLEPVLYAGAEPVERLNVGDTSGHLVVIVPDPERALDLAVAPIFFGSPALPERVTRAHAVAERDAAAARGVPRRNAFESREPQRFADAWELKRFAADLIETHSPEELDVVRGLRAKRLSR